MDTQHNKTLILSQSDIQRLVQYVGLHTLMDLLIDRMEAAIQGFDPEETSIPARSGFHYETPQTGLIEWMPLLQIGKQVVIKIVGYHPANPVTRDLPTIVSSISAYDTASGHLTGIMDGVLLTALRTGAASAVASRLLGAPDSRTLGLIGAGAQAITQLHALSRVFDLKDVLVYDAAPSSMLSFAERCAVLDLDLKIQPVRIEELVTASDLLCTATSIDVGAGPLFSNLETRPHLHVNAVGSDFPGKVELPLDLLHNSFICPDFREQAIQEGECQRLHPDQIGPSLMEVVRNPAAFTYVQAQRSVFDSTGWALEDQVAMDLFLEYASELKLGTWIDIEYISKEVKNPYHFLEKDV